MNKIAKSNIFLFFGFSSLFFACEDPASITITNQLNNVTLQNISWMNLPVSYELLPGQEGKIELSPYSHDFPESGFIRFEMTAANRRLGLRTQEEIRVDEGEDIVIVIDSALQVTVQ